MANNDNGVAVRFAPRTGGPDNLVAEVELVFTSGRMQGLKLVGLSLWRGGDGELRCTFPSRAYSSGSDRRFFSYLRSDAGDAADVREFKRWVVGEFEARVDLVEVS